MSITAKNYAAQAEDSIKKFAKNANYKGHQVDSIILNSIADGIKESVKFASPDYGLILNDDYKGITGSEIRLPYEKITIEYYVPVQNVDSNDRFSQVAANKRVIFAHEISVDAIKSFLPSEHKKLFEGSDIAICISAFFANNTNYFTPCHITAVIPSKWDMNKLENVDTIRIDYSGSKSTKEGKIIMSSIPTSPSLIGEISRVSGYDIKRIFEDGVADISYEVGVLLELLEALSCKNIELSTFQSAPSKAESTKRAKKGKLPIYETKVLSLKTTETKSGIKATGLRVGHASPRQHLRRGHIRRLESGNIWVNSCIVGDASKGVINKSYEVTK